MPGDNNADLSVHRGFRVGDWLVQSSLNRLTRGSEVVQLESKTMDLLVFLAQHAGKVVSQETIIDAVWQVEAVSVGTLTHAIAELRKAFGDDAKNPTFIETIPKRGYRLLVEPEPGWEEAGEAGGEQESTPLTAPSAPRIGETLSHYRIVDTLGEGGMGEVYRAHDTDLHRDVAVKVLGAQLAESPDRIARFEREARAVAKLSHPNVLDVYELGRHGGRPFIATELLDGETLRETLEDGALGWRRAAEIVAAIADGIAAAHDAGIVHRDLKPSNVFLTADGRVKILDFGLARVRPPTAEGETNGPPSSTLTQHGAVVGTVGYMSPEQVRGEPADHRSDIFALGCVLYEAVSGRRAFERETPPETMTAILREEPTDISASGVALPQELADTVGRCLEKRPEARFQSASDLAHNLRSISPASSGRRRSAGKPHRRRVARHAGRHGRGSDRAADHRDRSGRGGAIGGHIACRTHWRAETGMEPHPPACSRTGRRPHSVRRLLSGR
jgi:serine/threonine protein kinase